MQCISFFVCCFSKSHLTTKTFPERAKHFPIFFSRIFSCRSFISVSLLDVEWQQLLWHWLALKTSALS